MSKRTSRSCTPGGAAPANQETMHVAVSMSNGCGY